MRDYEHVTLGVLLLGCIEDEGCVVTHNLQLSLQSELLLLLHDLRECIAHQSNKHVKESNLSKEGSREEQEIAQVSLRSSFIISIVEFTKS